MSPGDGRWTLCETRLRVCKARWARLRVHGAGSVHRPLYRRPSSPARDWRLSYRGATVIHARPGARTVSGADAWRGDGRFGDRRRNLAPPHQATSIANLDRARPRFPHQDRTLGRRLLTLPDQLKVARVVADDPVIREHAGLLELERAIERGRTRGPPMKVVRRRRCLGEADVVLGQIGRLQERIGRRRLGDP
jgi:hypothetical protein